MGVDRKMDVQLDVSKAGRVTRLEVLEGPTGRRTVKPSACAVLRLITNSNSNQLEFWPATNLGPTPHGISLDVDAATLWSGLQG